MFVGLIVFDAHAFDAFFCSICVTRPWSPFSLLPSESSILRLLLAFSLPITSIEFVFSLFDNSSSFCIVFPFVNYSYDPVYNARWLPWSLKLRLLLCSSFSCDCASSLYAISYVSIRSTWSSAAIRSRPSRRLMPGCCFLKFWYYTSSLSFLKKLWLIVSWSSSGDFVAWPLALLNYWLNVWCAISASLAGLIS